LDGRIRARMADLKALGQVFTVFSFGVPSGAVVAAMSEHADLVDHWEVVAPLTEAKAVIGAIVDSGVSAPPVHFNAHRPDVARISTRSPFVRYPTTAYDVPGPERTFRAEAVTI